MEKRGNENRHGIHNARHRGTHLKDASGTAHNAGEKVRRCGNGGKRRRLEGNGREEGLLGDEEKRGKEMGEEDREDSVRVFEEKKIENVDADRHDVWI